MNGWDAVAEDVLGAGVVAAAFAATWWRLWGRAFPEFRERLNIRVSAFLAGVPLVVFRTGSWRAAYALVGLILFCAWVASRGRVERFFPRRWFYATGQGPDWLNWIEILVFWSLLAAGVIAGYGWAEVAT